MTKQIISRERVVSHGEVFTSDREVHAMLDLVHRETIRIESRFLEPACGTGNFLVPIYERKLSVIKNRYSRSQLEFERAAIVATGSLYGVDILLDNVKHCRERLLEVFNRIYSALYKAKAKDAMQKSIAFILSRNIVHGDALSLRTVGEKPEPIIFSEWSPVNGSMIKRRDFAFHELSPDTAENRGLFADAHVSDTGMQAFIPQPVREFPITHYLELHTKV